MATGADLVAAAKTVLDWDYEVDVAISVGDGVNIIEAEGHARDILIDPAGSADSWSDAARLPGIDYGLGMTVRFEVHVDTDDDDGELGL